MSVVIIYVDLHLRQILLQPLYILFFTFFRKLRVESGTVKPSTIDIFKRPINSDIAMIFTFSIYVHIYSTVAQKALTLVPLSIWRSFLFI